MKILFKIILLILIPLSFLSLSNFVNAAGFELNTYDTNLNTGVEKKGNKIETSKLDGLKTDNDFGISGTGGSAGKNTFINIAKSLKNAFFLIATFYFMVLVVKLIFAENNEEEIGKFKKGIIWITVGLIVTQISYSFVNVLYGEKISEGLANRFNQDIIYPLIKLLETGASFVFVGIAIYAFFRMVTSNGDEEKVKVGKMSIVYSLMGFIIIKFARGVVDSVYGKINCNNKSLGGIIEISDNNCVRESDLSSFAQIIVTIIDWMNSFIGIIVILLIIYTGIQVILNVGDEERLKKAKTSIMFIVLGLFLLFVNYLILTFFLIPESAI